MANESVNSSPFAIRHSSFVIWLLILLPVAVLFGPVLFADRSFAMRDAAHFYHPLLEWTTHEWAASRVPLWNPHENCGVPVLADASSSLFYPGKLVFALPIDFTLRYKLYVIGHVVLAAAGSYLLARHWKGSQLASGAAALAYACGGNVVFQYCNVVFLVGAAWLPFAALAADTMLVGRSWRGALCLGVVLALMILGGEPQAAYHALLMTGIYAVALGQPRQTGFGALHKLGSSPFLIRMLLLGLAAGAGFLLAAIQILPSSEASRESERAAYRRPRSVYEAVAFARDVRAGQLPHVDQPVQEIAQGLMGQPDPTTHHERAYSFSVGPWRFAELVWPNISGRMFPTHRRWLSLFPVEGQIWTPTLYMGLFPILLALAQLRLRRGEARARWLTWVVIVFALGSLGWYSLGWVAREFCTLVLRMDRDALPFGSQVGGVYWLMTTLLPSYVNFRYPAKLLVVAALALSQLAAFGWDRVFAEERKRFVVVLEFVGGASAVLLVFAWGTAAWLGSVLGATQDSAMKIRLIQFMRTHADGTFGPFDIRGSLSDVELAFAQTAGLCFGLVWMLRKSWKDPERQGRWQLAALFVVALDLAVANYWLVPTAPATNWREPPAAAQVVDVAQHPRVFRADLGGWRPAPFRQRGSGQRMSELAEWERDTLFPKYPLNHKLALVESYGSLKSVHYESLLYVARKFGPPQPGEEGRPLPGATALRLVGTEYLMLPGHYVPGTANKLFATKVESHEPLAIGATLWKMNSPLPRAWAVHEVATLPPLPARLDLDAIDQRAMDVLYPADPLTQERKPRNFCTTAVVEAAEPIVLAVRTKDSARLPTEDSCRILRSEPALVELEVNLASEGLVVLGDTFSPGWVALLRSAEDDKAVQRKVRIHRTNRVFRGVIVPEGRHVLTCVYRPANFFRGAAVSLLAWTGLGLAVVVGVIRRRRQTSNR